MGARLLLLRRLAKKRRRQRIAAALSQEGGALAARLVVLERFGRLRLECAELPGRREKLLIIRGFAAHVSHQAAFQFVKNLYWGHDATTDDMRWLTQWKFIDWPSFDALLGETTFSRHVRRAVDAGGFGQVRWYGAGRETSRHSDGFDGTCASTGEQTVGRSRNLLRLGGDGFLRLYWEPCGGRRGGKFAVVLKHGDLVLMDRAISGTRRSGFQRQRGLLVTHRAGGMASMHAPASASSKLDPRSFVTLIWTCRESRNSLLRFFRRKVAPLFGRLPEACDDPSCWPKDPDAISAHIWHRALRLWDIGLSLADRQQPP